MKKYIKYITILVLGLGMTFSLPSCTEDILDDINNNDNNQRTVIPKLVLADVITKTSFYCVGGEYSLYSSIYTELEAGIDNQMFNAEMRRSEPTSSTTYDNTWGSSYENIKNAKLVIRACSPGGIDEGNHTTLGIAKVLLAYNAALLTDLFGDVPYFQAGEMNGDLPMYLQAKVDKQEDIYEDIMKQLDEAIVLFDSKDLSPIDPIGKEDFIYQGDPQKWKKAAYALKARYTMRLLAKSTDQTASLNSILKSIEQSFTTANDELKFNVYNGEDLNNPLAAFSLSRRAFAASKSFVNKLTQRQDPRVTQMISEPREERLKNPPRRTDASQIVAGPNGNLVERQLFYDILVTNYSWETATLLLSYHELLFIKAEAYARLNDKVNAEKALQEAITVGFTNLASAIKDAGYDAKLDASVSMDYYTKNVKPLFDANPISEVMNQKYLSFAGASGESIEAYNDYRRMMALKENFVMLENPLNTNKFPLRFVYANSEMQANANVEGLVGDGTYVYSEPVWWAGGTR